MTPLILLGAGKIGETISHLLQGSGDYALTVADQDPARLAPIAALGVKTVRAEFDDREALAALIHGHAMVVSAVPFYLTPTIAEAAVAGGAHYFDLTEDVESTRRVKALAVGAKTVLAPQCGLAPGFISILAHAMTRKFESLRDLHMRVGALPVYPTNALKYNLTWSTDGLINEYCNPCEAIHDSRRVELLPLEGYEQFLLDGVQYEAFNTSGGLGTLCDSLDGRVRELNYKTIRYLGHCSSVSLLVNELRLRERREVLKDILESAVPVTFQDLVVTFCAVTGWRNGQLVQITDARKVYHQQISGENWSAIQVTTAAGVCAALDLFVAGRLPQRGFLRQEQIDLNEFLANRFGRYYAEKATAPMSIGVEPATP